MRPLLPRFTQETASQKVRSAEDGWNGRDPQAVSLAYSVDRVWRNRNTTLRRRDQIIVFLKEKWAHEHDYRLIKDLFAFEGNRIAVRFAYEYQNSSGLWFRAYGNENWVFDSEGRMATRFASINDVQISNEDRLFHWPQGRRPKNHPGLSELNL